MDSVVHFEIVADDLERAKGFYSASFGWELTSMPPMGYVLCTTTPVGADSRPRDPGAINGGMMQRPDWLPGPVITIGVEDMDKAVEKITVSGGQIIRDKLQVGDIGWAAYFKDSEGNVLGLFQPSPGE